MCVAIVHGFSFLYSHLACACKSQVNYNQHICERNTCSVIKVLLKWNPAVRVCCTIHFIFNFCKCVLNIVSLPLAGAAPGGGKVPGFRSVSAPTNKPPGEKKAGQYITCSVCGMLIA